MRLILNMIVMLCLLSSASYAQSFMNITAEPGDSFDAVLVEKSGHWLHLLKVSEGQAEVIKSFQVLTGGADGDKLVQGDEKTPEGVYFVTGYLSPAKLKEMYGDVAKQYGTGAFPLSYPNLKDRLDRKTGGGIWLHGVDPHRQEPATKGCVAFENENLDMLKSYIKVGTPVVITSEGIQGAVEEVRSHFNELKQAVQEYLNAWQESDFGKYSEAFATGFKDTAGRTRDGYLKYKKYLMDLFPYRVVRGDNFRIFSQNNNEGVAEFDQFYCAPNVVSYGRKRFYMEREGGLKIKAEEFIPMDASDYIRSSVNEFLIGWKKAWEGLDIDSYMSYYAVDFSTRGMDKAGWKDDKAGKFAALKDVKVQIENIRFEASSPVSYTVTFTQKYQGDAYSDTGVKTIRLTGCPGDFKIKSEIWRAM